MNSAFETVSVEEAIRNGKKEVVWPSVAILLSSVAIGFVGSVFTSLVLYFPLAMVLCPVIALLYYSKKSAKWRIWAFANVRNVHELKQRARNSGLMKEDGSPLFFDVGVSQEDKDKWISLQEKFSRPDIFSDDPQVQAETVVYYSKVKKYLTLLFYLPIVASGVVVLCLPDNGTYLYIWGIFLIALGAGLFYITIKDAFNSKPQIIINNEGISTAETPFQPWKLINNEKTTISTSGRVRSIYLEYRYPGGHSKFTLDGFTISRNQLEHLLRVYRGRATQKVKPGSAAY